MARAVFEERRKPEPAVTFKALNDSACRKIVKTMYDSPMTVQELSEQADVPLSTAYRKVERLKSASIVEEQTQLDRSGHHRNQYLVDLDRVIVSVTDDGEFSVDVQKRLDRPETQLIDMWTAVREQA